VLSRYGPKTDVLTFGWSRSHHANDSQTSIEDIRQKVLNIQVLHTANIHAHHICGRMSCNDIWICEAM